MLQFSLVEKNLLMLTIMEITMQDMKAKNMRPFKTKQQQKIEYWQHILYELDYYYARARAVGHTHLTIKGLNEATSGCIVLVAHYSIGQEIKKRYMISNAAVRFMTFEDIVNGKHKGLRIPLLIDNSAMTTIIENTLEVIQLAKFCAKGDTL